MTNDNQPFFTSKNPIKLESNERKTGKLWYIAEVIIILILGGFVVLRFIL